MQMITCFLSGHVQDVRRKVHALVATHCPHAGAHGQAALQVLALRESLQLRVGVTNTHDEAHGREIHLRDL